MTKFLKCLKCEANGLKSSVRTAHDGGLTPAMLYHCDVYYDEAGDYHCHDEGTEGIDYRCSQDHLFNIPPKCPALGCDWYADRDEKRAFRMAEFEKKRAEYRRSMGFK